MTNAQDTTPARAEAQDEGAAGEPWTNEDIEDLISDAIGDSMDMDWTYRDGARAVLAALHKEGFLRFDLPSPPAADEDRVREAVADVISHESDWREALMAMDATEETPEDGSGKPGYWLHQIKVLDRILAALKSTAAKEGGE